MESIFSWGRFHRPFCPLPFLYTPSLVHTLLQANNDRVAYIELFSSMSVWSLSSLGVVFIGLPVLCGSFTLPVWFTHCFKRTMTKWLTLNRSAVWHTTPYHSNRLLSLCIWQFSTCHVVIKFRKFKVLPLLHVQILIRNPRQTWVL
jgi:hypothetical protein